MGRMTESSIQSAIVKTVKAQGGWALKLEPASHAGVPDLITLWPGGRVLFVECKARDGVATPIQNYVHRVLHQLGFTVIVPRSTEEAKKDINQWLTRTPPGTTR